MKAKEINVSRRKFFKIGGVVGSVLSLAGAAGAGLSAGRNTDSYTGWERFTHGDGQFFNRKPFRVNLPTYLKVSKTRRIKNFEHTHYRERIVNKMVKDNNLDEDKIDTNSAIKLIPEKDVKEFYKKRPDLFEEVLLSNKWKKKQKENWKKFKKKYILADAWSAAHGSVIFGKGKFPKDPDSPPEVWDFQGIKNKPVPFKSPKHASELIKKICHTFGATLVGITKLNPDWVYDRTIRGDEKGRTSVPKHWKYAIVFGVAHEWDAMYANPIYGTSFDGYSQLRVIGGKLEAFIRHLGYPARTHIPPGSYDLVMPPLSVDAGLGEQGRHGVLITPELGSNTRTGAVTTNLEFEPDKPIDIGIHEFCKKCKICAEQCPSNSISFADEPEEIVRGYKKWTIDQESCHRIWSTVATSHPRGCRVCLAVCPYSRKNNWLHTISRETDARDPSGLVSTTLLAMQKKFFKYPNVEDYLPPPDGKNATYHEGPDWLQSEDWLDMNDNF